MVHWQPRRLTAAQLEERGLATAREFPRCRAGRVSQSAIARAVGVPRQTVSRWHAVWRREGLAGLRQHPQTGRPCRSRPRQWERLATILSRGAVTAGVDTERWTLRRIGQVVGKSSSASSGIASVCHVTDGRSGEGSHGLRE
jgi:transposase